MASPLRPRSRSSIERLAKDLWVRTATQEEELWVLRTAGESQHREEMYRQGVVRAYRMEFGKPLREMDFPAFIDTCNKSVPIYILRGDSYRSLGVELHNYIYRGWFRPYRSEIEHERFLCKFIHVYGFPQDTKLSLPITAAAMTMVNQDVCAEAEKTRRRIHHMIVSRNLGRTWNTDHLERTRFHIIQPLFRAILILVAGWDYQLQDSSAVGPIPAHLVLTGITDGLSAPITFESISGKIDADVRDASGTVKTTLETAVDFVMGLEEREAAAFGLRPDPVTTCKPPGLNGTLPVGPTSRPGPLG
ncbi:hypothetical protein F4808DRAFT_475823 [Astrocystis sublimbata]|nr:hypothetical protein F4808DRAFT_475823 [Astrocystis sublimbata]